MREARSPSSLSRLMALLSRLGERIPCGAVHFKAALKGGFLSHFDPDP